MLHCASCPSTAIAATLPHGDRACRSCATVYWQGLLAYAVPTSRATAFKEAEDHAKVTIASIPVALIQSFNEAVRLLAEHELRTLEAKELKEVKLADLAYCGV